MTLEAFRNLNHEERCTTWHTCAVQISERETQDCFYALYQLDGFYIEIKFFKWTDELPVMRTFSKNIRLEPYLNKININHALTFG